MGQLQKVSWRTVGYATLGTGARGCIGDRRHQQRRSQPTSLTSNAATRWLVDRHQRQRRAGRWPGRRGAGQDHEPTPGSDEVAVQGAGGAFLVGRSQGAVRTISTAKLQLGTAQPLARLTSRRSSSASGPAA